MQHRRGADVLKLLRGTANGTGDVLGIPGDALGMAAGVRVTDVDGLTECLQRPGVRLPQLVVHGGVIQGGGSQVPEQHGRCQVLLAKALRIPGVR